MGDASAVPVVSGPVEGGRHGWPFGRPAVDLDAYGYREAEFFLEGVATRFLPAGPDALPRDGKWQVEPAGTAPYKTRIVVYRPDDPAQFNGTVIVSWNNVSAGYDLYGGDTAEILEGGYAYVAVTTQRVGVHGIPSAPQGMATWDPERYGSLSIPSDDYSFDIFTQAARAIGRDRSRQPVDPMDGLEVRHLIAQGGSQSAGRLGTYANAIHPLARAFDGFLLTIYFGTGVPLEVGDFVINLADPRDSAQRGGALRGSNLLRDDLDVPVMVVNSELEAIACYDVRQPDTDRFRYWETAGTCHVSAQALRQRRAKLDRDGVPALPVSEGINRIPLVPVIDAAYHHLHRWVNGGAPPPTQPLVDFAGDPAEVVRDEHGIATGGIRLPQAEVPLATNSAIPLGKDIYSRLGGSCHPFPRDQVLALYGDRDTYLSRFEDAARAAEKAGVILPRDVDALIEEARAVSADAFA